MPCFGAIFPLFKAFGEKRMAASRRRVVDRRQALSMSRKRHACGSPADDPD